MVRNATVACVVTQSKGCQRNDLLSWSPKLGAGMLIHARIPIGLSTKPALSCTSNVDNISKGSV